MRAALRLGTGLVAAALALGPVPALAQDAGQASTNTPATDTIGPRELQNFNLSGRVTREADAPATTRAPNQATTRTDSATDTNRNAPSVPAQRQAAPPPARETATVQREEPRTAAPARQAAPATPVAMTLPKVPDTLASGAATATTSPSPGFATETEPSTGTLAPDRQFPLFPWLFAALAVIGGLGFLFWRNRTRHAFAGGPQMDAFAAPEPQPATPRRLPEPAAPPARPAPSVPGLVSTRLRPWIDFGFTPLRCVVDDQQVAVEFELELFNSGSAPARAVLVEATLFNAGANQDREIDAFFANPVGEGERIVSIPALKRVTLRTKVAIGREHVQIFEAGGRKLFVPLIAFNALYRWGGGEGQSSISYLVGRDTQGEKMAPFRMDLGPRVFRGLGSRLLPRGVRK